MLRQIKIGAMFLASMVLCFVGIAALMIIFEDENLFLLIYPVSVALLIYFVWLSRSGSKRER